MQLYGQEEDGQLIAAFHAIPSQNYLCPECRGLLRVRGGKHRHLHFFHLNASPHCQQSGKSMRHLQVQYFLQRHLPGTILLERPFPSIGRIADVVWEEEAIVFEVQCSPISEKEVLARNQDYLAAGYLVIWILHDLRFGSPFFSAAEHALQASPHYRTTLDADGCGIFYDQIFLEKGGRKVQASPLLSLSLERLWRRTSSLSPLRSMTAWESYRRRWPCGFAGDLIDRARTQQLALPHQQWWLQVCLLPPQKKLPWLKIFISDFWQEVRGWWHLWLEGFCR